MQISRRWLLVTTITVAAAAHVVLWAPLPYALHSLAMLTLCAFLPGLLLVDITVGRSAAPPTVLERTVLSIGTGYTALTILMLLLSYLPGPLLAWQVYLTFDLLLFVLIAYLTWQRQREKTRTALQPSSATEPPTDAVRSDFPLSHMRYWIIGILLATLIAGAFLRLGNIGYAEFHGDEARAVLRAAAVIQGYDDVLMLHKKGPAEILLPTATFALTGRVTETTARLPFALAGIASLLAIYLLGTRMFGYVAGLAAALLLMVDGYAVAFSRIVQYQSLVILNSLLVVLILYRLYKRPAAALNYLILGSVLLASSMLAHYEGVLVALPALYLFIATARRHPQQRRELYLSAAIAGAVGVSLLALFYVPFVRHDQFQATYTYLLERRIGGDGGIPYNNLADVFTRTTIYNSTYYVILLAILAGAGLMMAYVRGFGRTWGTAISVIVLGSVAVTVANPSWLTVGSRDLTALVFAAALVVVWFLPHMRTAERTLWLWFGALFLLTIFFTGKPRTHVYVFFPAWILLGSMVTERLWYYLRNVVNRSIALAVGGATAATASLLFGGYIYLYFVHTNTEILHTWQENRPKLYWTAYDTLDNRALFGFPLANGWKVVGSLYADERISGTYATNEFEFWTPIWYTRGEWRCEDQADWFFQISNFQADPEGYRRAIDAYVSKEYQPWGRVSINGSPRMTLHQRGQQETALEVFPLEAYEPIFDEAASAELPLSYPVVEPPIANPLDVNLGDMIRLEGYDLEYEKPLQPGDTMLLTLFWRAQRPIDESYKVFNQSYYGEGVMIAQQDGYPVCGARGTWMWDPGELIVDTHRITIHADAPDGLYPLYTGLYIEETFDRLDVLDERGNIIDGQVHIADIRVGEE